jgi:hypothetical protein
MSRQRGLILIEVERDTEFTEDERIAVIAALEFLFGERSDFPGEMSKIAASAFGFRLRGLFLSLWKNGSAEGASQEEQLMRARLEYPIVQSPDPHADEAIVQPYPGRNLDWTQPTLVEDDDPKRSGE